MGAETQEVAVGGEELRNALVRAERCDARVTRQFAGGARFQVLDGLVSNQPRPSSIASNMRAHAALLYPVRICNRATCRRARSCAAARGASGVSIAVFISLAISRNSAGSSAPSLPARRRCRAVSSGKPLVAARLTRRAQERSSWRDPAARENRRRTGSRVARAGARRRRPGSAITPREQGEQLFAALGLRPRFSSVPPAMLAGAARARPCGACRAGDEGESRVRPHRPLLRNGIDARLGRSARPLRRRRDAGNGKRNAIRVL